MTRMIDSPRRVFAILANQNIQWWKAIAELIDNSFDAGALRVEARFENRLFVIEDDGRGCTDLQKMVAIGSHFDQGISDQPVGMWGIGLKDAWAFCGETIEIESVAKGRKGSIRLSIGDIDANWDAPDPEYVDTSGASGTRIVFPLKRARKQPQAETWDRISWVFTPALEQGRQIVFKLNRHKKALCKPAVLPPFLESIDEEFDVEGKAVSIHIGIVAAGHKMHHGPFWFSYGHRNITHAALGAKQYGTMRMGGVVRLGHGWTLTKNKDDLSEFREELEDAIFVRIEDLLKKHNEIAEDIEATALKAELESMLNDSIRFAVKERRESPMNNTGTIIPRDTGRKRRHAKRTQPGKDGSARASSRRGFSIRWTEDESDSLGRYDGLDKSVTLNVSHPFIATAKAAGNRAAMLAVAVGLMAHTICTKDNAQKLLLDWVRAPFDETYGTIMKSVREQEVKSNGR